MCPILKGGQQHSVGRHSTVPPQRYCWLRDAGSSPASSTCKHLLPSIEILMRQSSLRASAGLRLIRFLYECFVSSAREIGTTCMDESR